MRKGILVLVTLIGALSASAQDSLPSVTSGRMERLYLRDQIPNPATHRIYMDYGTLGLDAYYDVHQRFFDLMMRDKGYTDLNYASRVFPGAMHDEAAWAERLHVPLVFLAGR
jgi:hypothetical protein